MKTLRKDDWFHADGFPIVVARRDPQEPFGIHTHEFSEIVIITGGRGLHVTGEDSWELAAGDVFVIGGSRPHDYLNMDRLSLINVLFEPEALGSSLMDLPSVSGYHVLFHLEPEWRKRHQFQSRLRLDPGELNDAVQLVDRLDTELQVRNFGFQYASTAIFRQLVVRLSRYHSAAKDESSQSLLQIAKTINYIQVHYAEQITLEDLIEMSGTSRRTYLRSFATAMQTTPIAYLIRVRLGHAERLLKNLDLSITDVAFAVGFVDSNYFARQFRSVLGISPREYRKRFL